MKEITITTVEEFDDKGVLKKRTVTTTEKDLPSLSSCSPWYIPQPVTYIGDPPTCTTSQGTCINNKYSGGQA